MPVDFDLPRPVQPNRFRRLFVRAIDALPGSFGRYRRPDIGDAPERPPAPGSGQPDVPPAVVSTGFARQPGEPGLPPDRTLAKGTRYQFFVEIARELTGDAIDTAAVPLPDMPAGTILQVALFG